MKKIFLIFSVIFIFTVLVDLKINESSLGMYCSYAPIGCESNDILFMPRPIRSDEWLVVSPYFISQTNNGFQTFSNLVGFKQHTPWLTGGGYKHWSVLFKPESIGQFFLDGERAYSFFKLFNIFLFIIIFYLFFISMNIQKKYSLLLSISILFTPFIQWWSAFGYICFPISLLVLITHLFNEKLYTTQKFVLYILLGSYLFALSFLHFYPPFQISLLLLVMLFTVGLSIGKYVRNRNRKIIYPIFVIVFSLLISGIIFFNYFIDFKSLFKTIQNSSYPGQRISDGGDFPKFELISAFYDMQLLNNAKPMGSINQSEAAGFFNIFLFIIPLLVVSEIISRVKHKKNDWLVVFMILYLTLILGWMLVGYPDWLAKVSLLERVPAKRAEIGLGVGGLILLIYSIYVYKYQSVVKYLKPFMVVLGFAITIYIGLYLRDTFPTFISNTTKIALISLVSGTIIAAAIYQRKLLFVVLFLIFSFISAGSVHPWRLGIQPITNSQFIQNVKQVQEQNPGKWAVYYSGALSPLLYANGIPTATGVYLYPQSSWWKYFDSEGKYTDIWNRFSHVFFILPKDKNVNEAEFILTSQDSFNVAIDPCSDILSHVGIQYIASPIEIKSDCVKKLENRTFKHSINIYRVQ